MSAAPPAVAHDSSRFARLEATAGVWPASALVAVLAQALSFFLYSHPFWLPPDGRWRNTIAILVNDPWTHTMVQEPQVRHRILGPLMAHVAGLGDGGGFVIWIVANTVLLALIYRLLRRRQAPPAVAGLTVFVIATTLVVITSQTWVGYPDSLAFLGLAICLWVRAPVALLIPAAATLLVDERAAAAFPLVLMWHYLWDTDRRVPRLAIRTGACAIATLAWVAYFTWFVDHFGIDTGVMRGAVEGSFLGENLVWVPFGVFFGLRFAWITAVLGPARDAPVPGGRAIYYAALVAACIPAILVADISRGSAFAFPAILIAVADRASRSPAAIAGLLAVVLGLNVLTPQFQYVGTPAGYFPLPLSLLRALL